MIDKKFDEWLTPKILTGPICKLQKRPFPEKMWHRGYIITLDPPFVSCKHVSHPNYAIMKVVPKNNWHILNAKNGVRCHKYLLLLWQNEKYCQGWPISSTTGILIPTSRRPTRLVRWNCVCLWKFNIDCVHLSCRLVEIVSKKIDKMVQRIEISLILRWSWRQWWEKGWGARAGSKRGDRSPRW